MLCVILGSWLNLCLALPTVLTHAKISENSEYTRLVFELNKTTECKAFLLTNPARLVVDLKHTKTSVNLNSLVLNNPLFQGVRVGHTSDRLRIVFDLKRAVSFKHFVIQNPKPPRLVIDLNKSKNEKSVTFSTKELLPAKQELLPPNESISSTDTETATSKPAKRKPTLTLSSMKKHRNVVVLIDAGHGGKDPGAIGPGGTYEKDVVLQISLKLAQYINQQPGMQAILTRSGDYYVPLRSRLHKARTHKGDVFISVHADALKNRRIEGSSVYALSQRGATSEMARWLAEKENYSELGGVALADKSHILRSVLIDLSQTATIGTSLTLGAEVLKELKKVTKLHIHRVEQAPFVVLKSPDIPSLLIETGFISNRHEEMKLRSGAHQRKLALAIMKGLINYLRVNPIEGTLFSAQRTYQVQEGDTLSSIAHKFQISVQSLKQVNQLTSSSVNAGHVLKLPSYA